MWSLIAAYKESLSRIANEVLDAVDEVEPPHFRTPSTDDAATPDHRISRRLSHSRSPTTSPIPNGTVSVSSDEIVKNLVGCACFLCMIVSIMLILSKTRTMPLISCSSVSNSTPAGRFPPVKATTRISSRIQKNQVAREDNVIVNISPGHGTEIYLYGACATSWKVSSGKDLLFVRPDEVFNGKEPISGGIPHCFPQFGPGPLQQHGFARNMNWSIANSDEIEGDPSVTLELK